MKLVESSKWINIYFTTKIFCCSENFWQLNNGIGSKLMKLSIEAIQNLKQQRITRKSKPSSEKIIKDNNFSMLWIGHSFIWRGSTITLKKETSILISFQESGGNLWTTEVKRELHCVIIFNQVWDVSVDFVKIFTSSIFLNTGFDFRLRFSCTIGLVRINKFSYWLYTSHLKK